MIGLSLGLTVMMQLGSFQFSISTAAYQELRRRTEYRWASQDRFGKMPALQFTGPGDDAITMTGTIYTEFRGGSGQLDELRDLASLGRPQLLVDGTGRLLGNWVIEGVEEGQSVFAGHGVPRKQQFTVNIKKRPDENPVAAIATTAASAASAGSASTLAEAKKGAESFLDRAASTVSSAVSTVSNAIKTVQDKAQQIGNAIGPVISAGTNALRTAKDLKQQIDSTKASLKNINSIGNLQSAMYSVMTTASTASQASTIAANSAKALGVNLQGSGTDPQTVKAVAGSEAAFGRGAVAAVSIHSGASKVASSKGVT